MMAIIAVASVVLIFLVLMDAFETMLLPRRVKRHVPVRPALLRLLLDAVGRRWPGGSARRSGGGRSSACSGRCRSWSVRALGGRADLGVRPAALGARHAARSRGESPSLGVYAYFSGMTFFTLGYGDVTPGRAAGPGPGGGRGGHRLRLPRRGHQLPAGALPGVLTPRGDHLAARRPRRLAADGRARSWPLGPVRRPDAARPVPRRVGALGRRGAGEPPLVPRAELLPLAARQPVVARRADGDPRHARRWSSSGVQEGDRSQAWLTFAMGRHVVVDLAQVFYARPSSRRPIACPANAWPPSRAARQARASSSATARPSRAS